MAAGTLISHTWMRSPLLPRIPLRAAVGAQRLALGRPRLPAKVLGGSTMAVQDVGGASLRLELAEPIDDGGYLLLLSSGPHGWVPAIAGVPGARYGPARERLAEAMVLARPLDCPAGQPAELTFLPEHNLAELFSPGRALKVVLVHRCTSFFLGLNAGRWLQIRMNEIAEAAGQFVAEQGPVEESPDALWAEFGERSGLGGRYVAEVEPPPEDASHLFEHYGMSNNSALPPEARLLHKL